MKRRIRDPVHGLIVLDDERDTARRNETVWRLLNTPEMQRLRRIRQLGVSEFTFPGATHTRFAHSVGVFHTACRLVEVIRCLLPPNEWASDRAEVAVFAALLHDIGHGPFSHAFEAVQKSRGATKHHEDWSADIILGQDGHVRCILDGHRPKIADDIADLLRSEVPKDVYHAIVSSSFDADRLDYLRRDRMMTGSGAGAIDFDWLLDNLALAEVDLGADDDEVAPQRTFCLKAKALQAAESFLLARYHLFEQVYLHKTTRGMEVLVREVLLRIAESTAQGNHGTLGLDDNDPLVRFFAPRGETVDNYLGLDDACVWAAVGRMARKRDEIAMRLVERRPLRVLDLERTFPRLPHEEREAAEQRWQSEAERLDRMLQQEPQGTMFKDAPELGIYGEVGADADKAHKRLNILVNDRRGGIREITQVSDVIRALASKRKLVRYYFTEDKARQRATEEGR